MDVPSNATVVVGERRYLLPGLADMHVHLQQTPNDLLVYVANGITTIRELTGRSDELRWRNEIARGERIGPSMWMSSSKTK